jgi:hypothetical protein
MTTATQIASQLRAIIKDYNFWPTSESDSPLKVGSSKGVIDDKKLLSLDASYRRKAKVENPDYVLPTRTIQTLDFHTTFRNLINNVLDEVVAAKTNFENDPEAIANLEMAVEAAEFIVQLYSTIMNLNFPFIKEISATSETTVGLVIGGQVGSGDLLRSVYAFASLVRT